MVNSFSINILTCLIILSMGVIVIEKIYHHTNSPNLSTHYHREQEEFWIKELGTASPYGCSDNVSSVGNLTSPSCSNINVMNLFPSFQRSRCGRADSVLDSHPTGATMFTIVDNLVTVATYSCGTRLVGYFLLSFRLLTTMTASS